MSRRAALLLAALPAAFLAIFFAWPVASIVALGVLGDGGGIGGLIATWTRPSTVAIVAWTAGLGIAATSLTLVLGLPAAWVFARFTFPGKRALRALVTVPFVLPSVVVAAAFLALLGPHGPVDAFLHAVMGPAAPSLRPQGSAGAIVAACVFYDIAVVIRLVGGLWSHIDPRTAEAAQVLGASPWRAFREVTWPLLRPAILSAASIILLLTVTSFGIVLVLGAPGQATLDVEIWRQTAIRLDLPEAAALAILQLLGVLAILLVNARAQERLAVAQRLRPAAEIERRPVTGGERIAVGGIAGTLLVVIGAPLAVLVVRSFDTGSGLSLAAWSALFEQPRRAGLFVPPAVAIADSLWFALIVLVVAGTLGLCAALATGYRRGLLPQSFDALVMLPLGIPAVTLGFGYIVTLDDPPLDLRSSWMLIPIAHAIVAIPFVVRAASPVIRSIDPRLRDAAAMLGAAPRRAWREVDGPIVARAALIGAGFAFAISLGEFGATLFIARPDTPTIPVAIFRLLGLPGALPFAEAMALSTILVVLTALAVLGVERLRGSGPSAF